MNPFILIYNSDFGRQDDIIEFLTQKGMKCTTVSDFSNCIFILSEIDNVNELSSILRDKYKFGRFAVFTAAERQGWMPKSLWNFYKEGLA